MTVVEYVEVPKTKLLKIRTGSSKKSKSCPFTCTIKEIVLNISAPKAHTHI